ncbi:uncharacterized protein LOC106867738 [Octopus bimaculoides]|uniref:Uncharacterized protein n=1 Tax=Octopus bimaculoides TaxID=37653 RepID=A0A0L8HYW5_OCTBM|nr:uncharacterized protein LOC106867738 [Octopus bimaculoides]|eukprot:XP_014768184.1 PREDICTED: uncharacterized protein LOC106867738 [Octopus bimaculoides]
MDSAYSELQKSIRKYFETENVVFKGSSTLHTEIPNMRRLMTWKCLNYECDGTCCTIPEFQVMNTGDISTLWIRNVIKEPSSWTFYDNKLNIAKIDLKINNKNHNKRS